MDIDEIFSAVEKLVGKLVVVYIPDEMYVRGVLQRQDNKYLVSFSYYEEDVEETFSATVKFSEDDVYKVDGSFITII